VGRKTQRLLDPFSLASLSNNKLTLYPKNIICIGFDVEDFAWVTMAQLEATGREDVIAAMKDYVQLETVVQAKAEHFDKHYDNMA
jgi:hypothetical protein